MILSDKAAADFEKELKSAIQKSDVSPETMGINSADLVKNKNLILSFLETLIAMIPGVAGKIAGQLIMIAAKAWFENQEAHHQ